MPDDAKPCSCGCGQPRDRPGQRYRRECHARYKRAREARRTAATQLCKRAGLTVTPVSASESGFVTAPQVVTRKQVDDDYGK